jgi:hypothetical protein
MECPSAQLRPRGPGDLKNLLKKPPPAPPVHGTPQDPAFVYSWTSGNHLHSISPLHHIHWYQIPKAPHLEAHFVPHRATLLPIDLQHARGGKPLYNGLLIVVSNVKTSPEWILFGSHRFPQRPGNGIILPIGTVGPNRDY